MVPAVVVVVDKWLFLLLTGDDATVHHGGWGDVRLFYISAR